MPCTAVCRMRSIKTYTTSTSPAYIVACQLLTACGAGVVGLHNGLPPSAAFPIKGISLRLDDDTTVDISDPAEVCAAKQSDRSKLPSA